MCRADNFRTKTLTSKLITPRVSKQTNNYVDEQQLHKISDDDSNDYLEHNIFVRCHFVVIAAIFVTEVVIV